ncbi:hypothetical protein, partial [Bifidobacterium saguini]|uniref:hypothetical protein n=1 Tax=Bifidobacterium saguini TaxID=762210 RepID=UPI0019D38119
VTGSSPAGVASKASGNRKLFCFSFDCYLSRYCGLILRFSRHANRTIDAMELRMPTFALTILVLIGYGMTTIAVQNMFRGEQVMYLVVIKSSRFVIISSISTDISYSRSES